MRAHRREERYLHRRARARRSALHAPAEPRSAWEKQRHREALPGILRSKPRARGLPAKGHGAPSSRPKTLTLARWTGIEAEDSARLGKTGVLICNAPVQG